MARPCPDCGYSAFNDGFCEDEFLEPCPCSRAPWIVGEEPPAALSEECEDEE